MMSAASTPPVTAAMPAPSITLPFDLFNFASVVDRLRLRMISAERCPDVDNKYYTLPVGNTDLRAIVAVNMVGCSALPPDAQGGHGLILPEVRDAWRAQGVTDEAVLHAATMAESRRGYSVRPMWDVLAGLGGNPGADPGDFPLYVITNPETSFGAAGIMLPYVCAQIAHRVGDPAIVIGSSIHECLVLACENAPEPEELAAMVRSINATVVDDRDILSDHVYQLSYGVLSTVI